MWQTVEAIAPRNLSRTHITSRAHRVGVPHRLTLLSEVFLAKICFFLLPKFIENDITPERGFSKAMMMHMRDQSSQLSSAAVPQTIFQWVEPLDESSLRSKKLIPPIQTKDVGFKMPPKKFL